MEKENKAGEGELKHLGFLRAAAVTTLVWLSSVYDYAKHNSGPLKPLFSSVEDVVNAVVAPHLHSFKDLLCFLDQKVDDVTVKFQEHAPAVVMKASRMAQELIQQGGPFAAARYAASQTKEMILTQTVVVWSKLDRLPPFHAVAEIAVPTAAHWSEKYNRVVSGLSTKGYTVFGYLPLVPLDDIAKAFKHAD